MPTPFIIYGLSIPASLDAPEATLSRAYVAVYEAGLVESKIAEIERRMEERAAGSANQRDSA